MTSILDAVVGVELRSLSTLEVGEGTASIIVDGEVKQLQFSITHPDEDLSRFFVWCVRPPTSAESSVREIRDRFSGGRALGHVFPITSFAPDSEFSAARLQGRFQQIFASVAAKSLIEKGAGNAGVNRAFAELAEITPLSEIFDPDLAIVVVGEENLRVAGVSEGDVKLLLQEAGYFLMDLSAEYKWSRVKPVASDDSCGLGRVSNDLIDSAELFTKMISLASQQASAVASVLIYYQVIEVVSEKLLAARLAKLVGNPPSGTWAFKEALRDVVSERSRIVSMCSQAASDYDAAAFSSLRDEGMRLLQACGEQVDAGVDAGTVLYLVRNIVVHNQSAINATAHGILNSFVDALHSAVFAIIRRLDLAAAH